MTPVNINLKIAIRNILKNKVHSVISIVGLGIGLGCIFLLSLLVMHERSFDRFIPDHQHLYRVLLGNDCRTSYPLGEAVQSEVPGVAGHFRYYQAADVDLKTGDNDVVQEHLFGFSDTSLFSCLGIHLKSGNPAASRTEVAVSAAIARKYFPGSNAVGKIIRIRFNDQFRDLMISGVYPDFPSNSTLAPNFIADIELTAEALDAESRMLGYYGKDKDNYQSWDRFSFYTYLRLAPGANPEKVTSAMQKYKSQIKDEKRKQLDYRLQPVENVYLESNSLIRNSFVRQGNAAELKYYLIIGLFILIVAVVNYAFLTRAKMVGRLRELGAKRALGASQSMIRNQILVESVLVSLFSFVPALAILAAGIPFLNEVIGLTLNLALLANWQSWVLILIITLSVALFSGLLIGLPVSGLATVQLLEGKMSGKPRRALVWQNSFLCIHFILFIFLVIGTIILKKQINYALTNFTAIDPQNIIVCELNSEALSSHFNVIKNEVDQLSGVKYVAGSSFIPPFNNFLPVKLKYQEESVRFDGLIMGKGMIRLLGLDLIDGEPFGDFQTEQPNLIVNESAARKYHLKAGDFFNGLYIRGIVRDFTAHSMRSLIQPMVIIQQDPQSMNLLAIKTDGKNDPQIMSSVNRLLKQMAPDRVVNSYHLSDQINQFYQHEQDQARLISAFSFLSIILSVMGLFGMTLNTITKKTKEIGIRKVNGATITDVLFLLNRNYLKWIAIAFVIATPLAYYAMIKWLENFAYKTELSWWIFALSGLLALGIALLTVSFQSWKAATKNPVESLRYE